MLSSFRQQPGSDKSTSENDDLSLLSSIARKRGPGLLLACLLAGGGGSYIVNLPDNQKLFKGESHGYCTDAVRQEVKALRVNGENITFITKDDKEYTHLFKEIAFMPICKDESAYYAISDRYQVYRNSEAQVIPEGVLGIRVSTLDSEPRYVGEAYFAGIPEDMFQYLLELMNGQKLPTGPSKLFEF